MEEGKGGREGGVLDRRRSFHREHVNKLRLDPKLADEKGARDFAAVDSAWGGREGGREGGRGVCEYFFVVRKLPPSLPPSLPP